MSNKFLPFVVENSTPVYIYSTLLSRSKGIPTDLILSVFSAILKMGITKVREYAQNLPEMSVEQLYGEIVNQFIPSERIDRENLGFFDDVCAWINQNLVAEDSWLNPELNKFSALDAYSFLYIMRYESLNYCDYDFSVFYNNEKDIQENLPFYVNLSNDGRPIQVKDSKDLYAFIASLIITADSQTYKIILEPNESLPF